MVKFSKELEAQLIPEWKNVYVNYRQLKKHVKRIKLARKPMSASDANYDFGRSIFDPVRDFFSRIYRKLNNGEEKPEIDQVINILEF